MQEIIFLVIFWAAVFVFVTVEGALVYAVVRFRRRRGTPRQVHGHSRLELAWTIAPGIVLAVVAVPTFVVLFAVSNPPAAAEQEGLQVKVVGHQ